MRRWSRRNFGKTTYGKMGVPRFILSNSISESHETGGFTLFQYGRLGIRTGGLARLLYTDRIRRSNIWLEHGGTQSPICCSKYCLSSKGGLWKRASEVKRTPRFRALARRACARKLIPAGSSSVLCPIGPVSKTRLGPGRPFNQHAGVFAQTQGEGGS